jgi:hypothetical protein
VTGEREREESFAACPATVLAFEGGPRVDLRWRLDEDERRALAAMELGPTFAVLTAERPGGDAGEAPSADELVRRERENVRRTLRFEELLVQEGVRFRHVDGSAPDESHRERCVAVALPRDEAARLAAERDQVALFWYDGARFWRWPAAVDEAPRPLPAASAGP